MHNKRNYQIFIDDILMAIEKIERYVNDKNIDEFSKDEMLLDAIVRNFEIIGEAANNIPKKFQDKYSFVEWKEMIGFRNVLIHNYFGIDVETLWQTIKKNIPVLKEHILKVKIED
ncbi:DUF86 domain-containing protein [bacterium]